MGCLLIINPDPTDTAEILLILWINIGYFFRPKSHDGECNLRHLRLESRTSNSIESSDPQANVRTLSHPVNTLAPNVVRLSHETHRQISEVHQSPMPMREILYSLYRHSLTITLNVHFRLCAENRLSIILLGSNDDDDDDDDDDDSYMWRLYRCTQSFGDAGLYRIAERVHQRSTLYIVLYNEYIGILNIDFGVKFVRLQETIWMNRNTWDFSPSVCAGDATNAWILRPMTLHFVDYVRSINFIFRHTQLGHFSPHLTTFYVIAL